MNERKNFKWTLITILGICAITVYAVVTPGHHLLWWTLLILWLGFGPYTLYAYKHRNKFVEKQKQRKENRK